MAGKRSTGAAFLWGPLPQVRSLLEAGAVASGLMVEAAQAPSAVGGSGAM